MVELGELLNYYYDYLGGLSYNEAHEASTLKAQVTSRHLAEVTVTQATKTQ